MIVYITLIIPVIMGVVLLTFFKHKIVWWELVIPFAYTVLFVFTGKYIAVKSLISDIEYVSGYVKEVRYYEDWNQYIHRTCCHRVGKVTVCRDCSYVQYHPEYWEAIATVGSYRITHDRYNTLANQFKSKMQFTELHRPSYTNDGDMYSYSFLGDDDNLEPAVTENVYDNRPKASLSLFHYKPLDTVEIKAHKPMDYPQIYDTYKQDCLFGIDDPLAHRRLQILNSRLGQTHNVKAFVIVYKNQSREVAEVQERYWEGSNRNEIVVCIGIDDAKKIQWVHDFSWTDEQEFKVEIRSFIEQQGVLNLSNAISFMHDEINSKWKEKDFHDFDYIDIEPTTGQMIWIIVLALVTNGLIGWWIVENDFE